MGIDPLTHKHISSISDENQEPKQQEPEKLAEEEKSNNAGNSSSSGSTSTTAIDPVDQVAAFLSKSPAFCTDEVPMIQPHEILVPAAAPPCTSSSSISSSSNLSSNSSAKAEEIQLPCMEWQESMYLWGLDDLMGWDSLCCDDVDGKLALDPFTSAQYHEAWKFELF